MATVEPHVREIAVDPKDSKKIYVALQVGYILKSRDGGASWKLLDKGLDADVHTIVATPTILEYALDRDRPFGMVIGGRARGHATILWTFRSVTGTAVWEEQIRSIARDFDGIYTDLPPQRGDIDATAEGTGAYLLWWMRRAKSNPRGRQPPAGE